MFRLLARLLMMVVLLLVIRSVILYLWKLFAGAEAPTAGRAAKEPLRAGGELKKDPVCGTFVSVHSAITQQFGGETVHFCSTACRDRYRTA